ncbi:MAG TPA: hypothetical protein VF280_20245 [Burkholderiales bacterium]
MRPRPESRITERAQYVRVDFGSGDVFDVSDTYRCFVDLCLGTQVSRALLTAGDNAPEGHRQLSVVLSAVARTAAIRPDFKLALVPSTPPIAAVYREAQQALRAIGLNAWVFRTVPEALEWLEGRAAAGAMVS